MATLDLGGSRVQYFEQGHGEPVVLLHSSASSSAQWRGLAERLSTEYRVIGPDLHGYGGTSMWPGHGAFRLEHEAKLVTALIERARVPAHLVGHSFGGAVALHVARTRPDLLSSLTVIEPVAFHLLRRDDVVACVQIIELANAVANAVASGDYFGGAARFVDYWSGPGAWEAIRPEKRPALAASLAKVALDFEATLNEPASLDDYASLALPTLVLQGTSSPRPTKRVCELLAQVLPDAELRTIEGAGHMAPLTHRDAVNALIVRHLEINTLERREAA
jgi:pimeloyl-ACP methyl ester carboxylesterase